MAESRSRRAQGVDREVARRIRQRRIMLGLTQQQTAELIGVTYQQAHKYELGASRVSAGRLYLIARALGVGVAHFFEEVPAEDEAREPAGATGQRRTMLGLARDFLRIGSREEQEALCRLARALASLPPGSG